MKVKLIGIILIAIMLISLGSASLSSDVSNVIGDLFGKVPEIVPTPNITLEKSITEVGFPDLSGYHPDCTFTLNNTGNGDGFATVDFKTNSGALLKKEVFPVPKNTAATYHTKVNMSLWPIPGSDSITYNIESTKSATPEQVTNAMKGSIGFLAETAHKVLSG